MDLCPRPESKLSDFEGATLRTMQWNFSPTMETGQYVCCLASDCCFVSRRGTHLACPGFRQCIRTSNTPSESKIAGSYMSSAWTNLKSLYPLFGEKDRFEMSARWQCDGISTLHNLVVQHVFNGIRQLCRSYNHKT